jgi:hypothetical protein
MAAILGSTRGHGQVDRGLLEAAAATAAETSPSSGPNAASTPAFEGRFYRMFPNLRGAVFFIRDLVSLAGAMGADNEDESNEAEVDGEENLGLPTGYTYFGQFVDHDLTLDAVSLSMKQEDPAAVTNFRTPALDLDCLYGRGPSDQPYMYEPNGIGLLMGNRQLTAGPGGAVLTADLARFKTRAIIGDKRNDENVIVSQLQGLFIQFHNRIAAANPSWSFADVRQSVTWHYQWLVLYDYLPRIVGEEMVRSILPHLNAGVPVSALPPVLKHFKIDKFGALPVEFSGAAYRFGHSMVRPQYRLSRSNDIGLKGRVPVFAPSAEGPGLNGFGEFNLGFGIEWRFFFETEGRTLETDFKGPDRIQPAYKIDTSLVFPLTRLPEFSDANGDPSPQFAVNALALRNLERGMMLSLPSGQAIARAMGLPVLTDAQLLVGKAQDDSFDDAGVPKITDPWIDEGETPPVRKSGPRTSMQDSAPLWFYVLAEARNQWKTDALARLAAAGNPADAEERATIINSTPTRLGPVGGRIVAETLIGLVWADKASFLRADHSFTPQYGDPTRPSIFRRFTVGDVATFVRP